MKSEFVATSDRVVSNYQLIVNHRDHCSAQAVSVHRLSSTHCSAYSTPRDDLVIYVSCLVLTALIYVLLSYEQSRQAILVLLSIFLSHHYSTVCFTISWLNLLLLVLISRKILDLCFWLQCIPAFHLEYIQILRSLQTLQTCSKVIASLEVQAPQFSCF